MVKHRKSVLWRDWTSILVQEGPQGVICIKKPGSRFWEFPGGKRHSNDKNPTVTVVRENREETGVRLMLSEVVLVGSHSEFNHSTHQPWKLYVFVAKISAEELLSHFLLSREGEEVAVFTWDQLNTMKDFSPFHRHILKMYNICREK